MPLNGTDEEGDAADANRYSFGDGAVDEPFSVAALVKITAGTGNQVVLARYDLTTGITAREWRLRIDSAEKLRLDVWDESAGALIAQASDSALATSTWLLIITTYDGSGNEEHVRRGVRRGFQIQ